jgi:hypothetical protein
LLSVSFPFFPKVVTIVFGMSRTTCTKTASLGKQKTRAYTSELKDSLNERIARLEVLSFFDMIRPADSLTSTYEMTMVIEQKMELDESPGASMKMRARARERENYQNAHLIGGTSR